MPSIDPGVHDFQESGAAVADAACLGISAPTQAASATAAPRLRRLPVIQRRRSNVVFQEVLMRHYFKYLLLWVMTVGLLLSAANAQAQHLPALSWDDLLKCELVVVGQLQGHKGSALSLEIVDVL